MRQSRIAVAHSLLLILLSWTFLVPASWAQAEKATKNILLLHSHDLSLPAYEKIQKGLKATLNAAGLNDDQLLTEFMDLGHNPDGEHRALMLALLHKRYDPKKIDLIITTYLPAFNFMLNEGRTFCKGVPMISLLGPESLDAGAKERQIALIPGHMDMEGTLKTALALLPNTQKVLVIHGPGPGDKRYEDQARRELTTWQGKLEFEYLSAVPMEELLKKVTVQPPQTVILFLNFSRDITGKPFTPLEVAKRISDRANAPVFGLYDTLIGCGVVGGSMLSFEAEGARTGELALRVLAGIDPALTFGSSASVPQLIFDWRQLKRWGISETALPAGSRVQYRTSSFVESYWKEMIGVIVLILLQSFLIMMLLINRSRRKKVQSAFRESESRFRAIFESSVDAIGVSKTGVHVFANPSYLSLYGYTDRELSGKPVLDFIAPEEHERIRGFIRDRAEGKPVPTSYTTRGLKKDGTVFDMDINVSLYCLGGDIFTLAVIRDISERKQIENRLKQSEERLLFATRSGQLAVWDWNVKENIMVWDDRMFELYGTSRDAFPNCIDAWTNGLHPDDKQRAIEECNAALRGEKEFDTEFRVLHPDGKVLWIKANGLAIRDDAGNATRMLGLNEDITERKKTEDELQSTNTIFSSFMKYSPIYSYIKEVRPGKSIVLRVSDNYEQMLGMQGNEMIGKSMEELFPADLAASITADDWAVVSAGKVLTVEERLNEKEYHSIKFPIVFGGRTLLAGYTIDITEQRKLEASLRRSEKLEALGQLAGGVAHDLNNVLGVSMIYAELLQEQIPEGSPLRKAADSILSSTRKAAAMIEDLLTLARRGVVVSEVTNLNRVVSGFLESPVFKEIKALKAGMTFTVEYAKDLLNMKGSPVHLEKTLMNLVSNAADAVSGRGAVTIRTESRYLDRPVTGYDEVREGEYAVLTVSDTGVGISPKHIGKIFEPFYTRKTMGKSGTGLGLAIVWGTVKDHQGYVDVRSEEGRGSTFTLYFPVTREEIPGDEARIPVEKYRGRGESVLVVDDVAEQRQVATALLTKLGYRVDSVAGGEEAVEYLRGTRVDILILDMIMDPGIDGLETYKRVREVNPQQKAIIVSGFAETERVRGAQQLGAGAYVKKPYMMDKLALAVRNELDRQ